MDLWPNSFIYTGESIPMDMSYPLLRFCLSADQAQGSDNIIDVIEEKRVHNKVQIQWLPQSHPIGQSATTKGEQQRGLFATDDIPEGTILGEYVGEIRLIKDRKSVEEYCKANIDFDYTWLVDVKQIYVFINAKQFANEMAFVNHYQGIKERPNVRGEWAIHRGSYFFVYVTTCPILQGEEILIDYGSLFQSALKSSITGSSNSN